MYMRRARGAGVGKGAAVVVCGRRGHGAGWRWGVCNKPSESPGRRSSHCDGRCNCINAGRLADAQHVRVCVGGWVGGWVVRDVIEA